ncbi:hypothetical protein GLW00_00125 [Halobacillus litoralis]|uniref:Uncharacterized protein n=1 Tax=Halobacillus litoralis TaxID=45668 RepID=A0A845F688_9BACI|nr:hypothetical protein [Halobacillus litoralis]MYL69235.1 hypothetical protein [Halobacillus litoralis]
MLIEVEQRIYSHSAYKKLEGILELLDEIESDTQNIPTKQLQMLGRIRETLDFTYELLNRIDPWHISLNTLNNLNNPLTNSANELTNYKRNNNEQQLKNVFNNLESLLPFLSQLTIPRSAEDIGEIKNSVVKFRQSIGQHLSNLEKEINETHTSFKQNKDKVIELNSSIDNQKKRIDTIINDFQNQFLNAQTERNEKTEETIKSVQKEFDEIEKNYQMRLDELLKGQESTFKESLEEHETNFDSQSSRYEEEYNALLEKIREQSTSELEQIQDRNKEAEKIVGIISMKGLAHGYQNIANIEGRKASLWNIGSLVSIAIILWFGYEFIITNEGVMEWTTLVSRTILTGVGLTLFTYCAKQAGNHRFEERRNRKIELELASLDPYLKDLDEEEQKQVKQSLVNKYFGVEIGQINTVNNQNSDVNEQSVINSLLENKESLHLLADKIQSIIKTK